MPINPSSYSEAEYQKLQALVFDLAHEFRNQWEADPFEEPDLLEYLNRAETEGNSDVRDELGFVLETYVIYFAPTPKLTDAQIEERMDKIHELMGINEQSSGQVSGTDESSNGGSIRS